MARTLTAATALNIVAAKYPRLITDGYEARLADEVQSHMWLRYPWKQSLAELPPFHPVLEEPDYGPPVYAVPTDFFGFHDMWLRNSWYGVYPLIPLTNLRISVYSDIPSSISHQPERNSFRLFPRPSISAPEWWVEGVYKKTPTKITNSNLNSYLLPWDDVYFEVFRRGLIWKILEGSPQEMESYMMFERKLKMMAESESIHDGFVINVPQNELALGD